MSPQQIKVDQIKSPLKALQRKSSVSSVHRSRSQRRRLWNHLLAQRLEKTVQRPKSSTPKSPQSSSAHPAERMRDLEGQHTGLQSTNGMEARTSSESLITSTDLSGRVIIDTVDEDALPVDHPRRSYDVIDFLHRWRSSSSTEEVNPPQHSDVVRLSNSRLSLDQVRRQDLDYCPHDMQGIEWSSIRTDRHSALAARMALHPSHLAAKARQIDCRSVQDLINAQSERYYRFASFHPYRMRISHFQLRHLIDASSRAAVYYADRGEVIKCSLASPSAKESVVKVTQPSTFQITCLNISQGSTFPEYRADHILVVGGFHGEYAMLNLAREHDAPGEGHVAPAENGLVTHVHTLAHRRSGTTQAVFCTNDHQVRTLDTRTLQWTSTFTYPSAINCSATSPDSRLRVLAGDDNDISIADAEKGDVHVTLRGHTDDAFACAWSPDGRHVATGAQDTTVRIWDARNWSRALACLPSVQTCPRSLHFAAADAALVVAENDDVVSIHEPTTFAPRHRQDLRFFGAVAGVALLDGGAEIVVANADPSVGGLLAFQRTRTGFASSSRGAVGGLMDELVV
nr:putative wd repeat-containing protein c2a9.03 [Quercus suber]